MLGKIIIFLHHYLLETLLLTTIIVFLVVQRPHLVFVFTILFLYTVSILFLNNNFFFRKIGQLLKKIKKIQLEIALLITIVILSIILNFDFVYITVIVFSYVFFALLINDTFFSKVIKKGIEDIKKNYLHTYLILIVLFLCFIWQFSFESIIFITIFIAFTLYSWDSRITAMGALILLTACPFILIAKQNNLAETMTVYAYYFLLITIVLQIVEYKRHPGDYLSEKNYE